MAENLLPARNVKMKWIRRDILPNSNTKNHKIAFKLYRYCFGKGRRENTLQEAGITPPKITKLFPTIIDLVPSSHGITYIRGLVNVQVLRFIILHFSLYSVCTTRNNLSVHTPQILKCLCWGVWSNKSILWKGV